MLKAHFFVEFLSSSIVLMDLEPQWPVNGIFANNKTHQLFHDPASLPLKLCGHHGEVLAFVCLRDLTQAWDLTMVATKLERQRSGVMEKLMSFIIGKYAIDRPLWLEVHQNNRGAQKFYKKMGFQHTGNRGGYYSDGSAALLFTFQNPLLY
jgi:ribosomal protein S18 acetylase RimI-like enzyme